jgi:uncharacterized protein (TIGR02453 family)
MAPKKPQPFEGFPSDLPEFLWGLALNNERSWFEAHREQYERCLNQPFRALAWAVGEKMQAQFPDDVPFVHVSRIYRDARRLYGRGPYKDHLWFTLGLPNPEHKPTPHLWFEIEARCCCYGVGLWDAKADTLERWRQRIDVNPAPLSAIVRKLNRVGDFALYGQRYKRPKGDPGKLLFDWYNTRDLGVEKTIWFEPDTPGPELVDTLVTDYTRLMPLYKYLLET